MLLDHFETRNGHDLQVIDHCRSIEFGDTSGSRENRQTIYTHNAERGRLRLFAEKARHSIKEVGFIREWLIPHLYLPEYPTTRSPARVIINSFNDKSIEETDPSNQKVKASTARREELTHTFVIILEHAVSDIFTGFRLAHPLRVFIVHLAACCESGEPGFIPNSTNNLNFAARPGRSMDRHRRSRN